MAAIWAVALVGCGRAPAQPARLAPGDVTATATAAIEHGQTLFRNKGCVTCHVNTRVPGDTGQMPIGPNLSSYANDAAFLRQWLADPRSVRPTTVMPDLELTPEEIDALIAFLNAPR